MALTVFTPRLHQMRGAKVIRSARRAEKSIDTAGAAGNAAARPGDRAPRRTTMLAMQRKLTTPFL
ncbi:MAG TPA: hypothetical protein VF851_11555, partial [Steroidobacteraceae bacterium]